MASSFNFIFVVILILNIFGDFVAFSLEKNETTESPVMVASNITRKPNRPGVSSIMDAVKTTVNQYYTTTPNPEEVQHNGGGHSGGSHNGSSGGGHAEEDCDETLPEKPEDGDQTDNQSENSDISSPDDVLPDAGVTSPVPPDAIAEVPLPFPSLPEGWTQVGDAKIYAYKPV